ncbi:hypothetical protein CAPTEDRAFT_96677, partial [Capitella teleta]
FLIYMNDLEMCSGLFHILNYADDSTLMSTLKAFDSNEELINRELSNVNEWLLSNKLSMNISKTKYMIFHQPKKNANPPNIVIDGN